MAIFGPSYPNAQDIGTDVYSFSNSSLVGDFGSTCTVVVIVGGRSAVYDDATISQVAIVDSLNDTGTVYHVFGQSGLVINNGAISYTSTTSMTNSFTSNHPIWVRVAHCSTSVKNISSVKVSYYRTAVANEGIWSTVILIPGTWNIGSTIADQLISPTSVSFSSTTQANVYSATQTEGSISLLISTLDGGHDHASQQRRCFLLGSPDSNGYYSNASYPSSISYSFTWYNDLLIEVNPNLTNTQRSIYWNVDNTTYPTGNPYPGNNSWVPTSTTPDDRNWVILNLVLSS